MITARIEQHIDPRPVPPLQEIRLPIDHRRSIRRVFDGGKLFCFWKRCYEWGEPSLDAVQIEDGRGLRESERSAFEAYNHFKYLLIHAIRESEKSPLFMTIDVPTIARLAYAVDQCRNRIYEANASFPAYLVSRRGFPEKVREDAVAEAGIAMMHAIERYNPDAGNGFAAYARTIIDRHLSRWAAKSIGSTAKELNVEEQPDSVDDTDRSIRTQVVDLLTSGLLDKRQELALRLRYGIDCQARTYEQVGRSIGVTYERARQIVLEAEKILRDSISQKN